MTLESLTVEPDNGFGASQLAEVVPSASDGSLLVLGPGRGLLGVGGV